MNAASLSYTEETVTQPMSCFLVLVIFLSPLLRCFLYLQSKDCVIDVSVMGGQSTESDGFL